MTDREDGIRLMKLAVGAGIFFFAVIFHMTPVVELTLFFTSYLLAGGEIVARAAGNIRRGQVFDENFLMSVSTIGAFAIGEYPEGAAVMLFFQFGELLQDAAVDRSRRSIAGLMKIRPDYANLKLEEGMERVSPGQVDPGDIIIVKPGERIPLDGMVADGASSVDTSALTGESIPREIRAGDEVLAGFVNKNGRIEVKVSRVFAESTISRILNLVENAGSKKAKTEKFITRFARYYTPAVVFAAMAIALFPPLVMKNASFSEWFYRGLIFLVISCPCALVVSIPLGFFGGIGNASRNGILVKGGNYLEALNSIDTVVFDKTGTLTKGVFRVERVLPRDGISEDELLEYAALAESYSNHPIAQSIMKAYGKEIDRDRVESYNEAPGYGVEIKTGGRSILAGNARMMERDNIPYDKSEYPGTVVYMAVDRDYAGCLVIGDEIKEDAAAAIAELKLMGVRKVVMLTGDNEVAAAKVAGITGIDEFYSGLLPDRKVEKVEELEKGSGSKGKLVFVGDGINDAPVLARSDIGVAMGGLGSDAAIEAADIVLMTDEPGKLADAIRIARRTRSIVWQNIVFALGMKGIVMVLGAAGMATMWAAVFADVGVAVIAVLNSLRTLK
ncbi:MAG: ATPase [Firmicutes bacterium]|nr:ATPase [Bacillota bacterium]